MDKLRRYIQDARDPEIVMALLGVSQAIGITSALLLADGPQADTMTRILSVMRGGTMGTSLSFGLMYVAHAAPRTKAKQQQRLLYSLLVGLMIVSPIIIAPAVQFAIPPAILANNAARWAWAIAIATAPDLIAAAVAIAAKGPSEASEPKPQPSEPKPAKVAPRYVCQDCKRECQSQNALNAHRRIHRA